MNTVSFPNFSSDFTIKPWSIAITYSDNFGWNSLPCDSEECLGESITHFINILGVGK